MLIREEQKQDVLGIETLLKKAFANHPYSKNDEYLMVAALRQSNAINLSLVAEDNDEIVGYIAFSTVLINGKDIGWQGLAPVAVSPGRQNQGIGAALINRSLSLLQKNQTKGCILIGFPDYYQRFGFKTERSLTVADIPPEFFMVLPFNTENIPIGEATFHKAFSVTH